MPGPIVASEPDTEAIMPRRILTSRAYQLVPEPVSQAIMHFSGSLGDNSQNTRCGLSGLASCIARFCRTSHQPLTFFSFVSRQDRSGLRSIRGSNLSNFAALSRITLTYIWHHIT